MLLCTHYAWAFFSLMYAYANTRTWTHSLSLLARITPEQNEFFGAAVLSVSLIFLVWQLCYACGPRGIKGAEWAPKSKISIYSPLSILHQHIIVIETFPALPVSLAYCPGPSYRYIVPLFTAALEHSSRSRRHLLLRHLICSSSTRSLLFYT